MKLRGELNDHQYVEGAPYHVTLAEWDDPHAETSSPEPEGCSVCEGCHARVKSTADSCPLCGGVLT